MCLWKLKPACRPPALTSEAERAVGRKVESQRLEARGVDVATEHRLLLLSVLFSIASADSFWGEAASFLLLLSCSYS